MLELEIPASKSISNRALIVNAITGNKCDLYNLSTARDTQTMIRLLSEEGEVKDVLDAGTVMRFLTAYYSIIGSKRVLQGTDRMHQRPIKILVDQLNALGAKISYLEKDGYPPLSINGYTPLNANLKMAMEGSVSSQYISAVLMIAPMLKGSLELSLTGKVNSKPYIQMTLDVMKHFGVRSEWRDNTVVISKQEYEPAELTIEPDWSSASYWYSYVSISGNPIFLKGYAKESLQGDSVIADIYKSFGVTTEFKADGISLTFDANAVTRSVLELDFAHCPDMVQTVLVTAAFHNVNMELTGVESLRIKETDRVKAMQSELAKIGAVVIDKNESEIALNSEGTKIPSKLDIHTYEDHRMAMAFTPLRSVVEVTFDDESVVNKSYPSFWEDCEKVYI